jgi:hypothetical protein
VWHYRHDRNTLATMTRRRIASTLAALAVGAIAAYASYTHQRELALRYGQPHDIAALLPLSVDGLIVVATVALADGRRYRWSAWLAFWCGVLATVLANVLAAPSSVLARAISAWPAVALLLTVEVITRGARAPQTGTPAVDPLPVPKQVVPSQVSPAIEAAPPVPVPPAAERATPARRPPTDAQVLAGLRNPRRVPRDPDGTVPIRRAASTLGIGPDRARRLLAEAGLLRTGDEDQAVPEPAADGTPEPVPATP